MLYNITLQLITYGLGNIYNPDKFEEIKNSEFVKPTGGLWTTPTDSLYGWKDWCEAEDYGDLSTYFLTTFNGNCFQINSLEDLKSLPLIENMFSDKLIDFEDCLKNQIDAIWLTEDGEQETRMSTPNLYGWDCECVLILNKESIKNKGE